MENLFRKKSLEKLSSPEQLDKRIVINSPLVWIALIGGAFIIVVTLVWTVLGRVPITEEGKGIILNSGSLTSVYSKTQGVITKSYISSGEAVKEGDVLYEVKSEEVITAAAKIAVQIKKVTAVTLESSQDEATNENQSLLEVKAEIAALGSGNKLNGISLADLESRYEEKQNEVDDLAGRLSAAESNYYNAMAADNGAGLEYDYTAAASEYQAAEQMYQAADTQYETAKVETESYKSKWQEYKALYEQDKEAPGAAEYAGAAKEYKEYYVSAKEVLSVYKDQRNTAKAERDSRESVYESAKSSYENYIGSSGYSKSELTRLSNEYNQTLSLYSSAKAELDGYATQIANAKTQGKVDSESQSLQRQNLELKFETTKEIILEGLNQEKNNYDVLQEGSKILASVSGTVYSTFVANGSTVTIDSEVVRISTDTEGKMYAVYYMDLDSGKNVKKGMEVHIYPTNVSKEEYGHMKGEVVAVANYVTSQADLFAKLGDQTLANTFGKDGSVIEITCEIARDDNTVSGFFWSSQKGANSAFLSASESTL